MQALLNVHNGIGDFATKYVLLEAINVYLKDEQGVDLISTKGLPLFVATPGNLQYASDRDIEISEYVSEYLPQLKIPDIKEKREQALQKFGQQTLEKPSIEIFSHLLDYGRNDEYPEDSLISKRVPPGFLINKINDSVADNFEINTDRSHKLESGYIYDFAITEKNLTPIDEMFSLERKSNVPTALLAGQTEFKPTLDFKALESFAKSMGIPMELFAIPQDKVVYDLSDVTPSRYIKYNTADYVNNILYRLFITSHNHCKQEYEPVRLTQSEKDMLPEFITKAGETQYNPNFARFIKDLYLMRANNETLPQEERDMSDSILEQIDNQISEKLKQAEALDKIEEEKITVIEDNEIED